MAFLGLCAVLSMKRMLKLMALLYMCINCRGLQFRVAGFHVMASGVCGAQICLGSRGGHECINLGPPEAGGRVDIVICTSQCLRKGCQNSTNGNGCIEKHHGYPPHGSTGA